MKEKLIEFLELEQCISFGPWTAFCGDDGEEHYIWSERESCVVAEMAEASDAVFIAQSRTIAPLAVRKLLEAVELLEKVIHYGKNCREGAIYIQARGEIVKQIQKFMEDFNNEN
jgi:hypothetical protein